MELICREELGIMGDNRSLPAGGQCAKAPREVVPPSLQLCDKSARAYHEIVLVGVQTQPVKTCAQSPVLLRI